jgi:hypothetical protein
MLIPQCHREFGAYTSENPSVVRPACRPDMDHRRARAVRHDRELSTLAPSAPSPRTSGLDRTPGALTVPVATLPNIAATQAQRKVESLDSSLSSQPTTIAKHDQLDSDAEASKVLRITQGTELGCERGSPFCSTSPRAKYDKCSYRNVRPGQARAAAVASFTMPPARFGPPLRFHVAWGPAFVGFFHCGALHQ